MAHSVLAPLPAPLLFREVGLLALAAGIVAWEHPVPAACAGLIMAWVDARARGSRLAFLVVCFAVGLGLGWWSLPGPPDESPAWLNGTAIRVQGNVTSTRDMPDQRLRIILERVRPADVPGEPLREKTVWSWEKPTTRPLPGQVVTATLKIRPVRGFLNQTGSDIGDYWRAQGVAWSAWSNSNATVELTEPGTAGARMRAAWRERLYTMYGTSSAPASDTLSGSPPAEPAGAALIPALLFGDQSGLRSDDLDRVGRAGLRHSLALSGQHLAVVGVLALLPVAVLKYLLPGLFLLLPRGTLIGVISLPLAGLCLWLGDAPPSLIRAAVMLLIWVLAQWHVRPLTLLDGLCIALACMIAAQPSCLFDLSVQLSFLAVTGMAVAGPWLRHHITPDWPQWPKGPQWSWWKDTHMPASARKAVRSLVWAVVLTVAAQIATLPLVLHVFGRAAPGLIANVLWLPVLGLFVLPMAWTGMLLLVAGLDTLAGYALTLAMLPCTWLIEALRLLDAHNWLRVDWSLRPHWTAMIGAGALMTSLALLFGHSGANRAARHLAAIGALLCMVSVGVRFIDLAQQDVRIRLLDVGQGQAVLLEWPGGRGMIDGGGFASTRFDSGRDILAPVLTANRPPRLDFAAISHIDRDHVGGILFLLDEFDVPLCVMGKAEGVDTLDATTENPEHPAQSRRLVRHDQIRLHRTLARRPVRIHEMAHGSRLDLAPGLWLEALWPPPDHVLRGNDSLVLRLVREGHGLALFAGDLPPAEQRAMLLLHGERDLRADVLVLPHHGSRRNLEPNLYDAVRPKLALAAAGANNAWGFPSLEVQTALAARHIPLHATSESGEIFITFDNGKPVVSCSAQTRLRKD